MGSSDLPQSNEARTCGIATRTIGASLGTPSDARSNPAAEPGAEGRPDNAGAARARAPRDPAEGWEPARKGDSVPEPVEDRNDRAGGRVSPPAKSLGTASRAEGAKYPLDSVREPRLDGGAFGGTLRCVGKRVDALVVAFRLEISPAVEDEISERQALADETGAAELRLGEFTFELKRTRTQSVVRLENADIRGRFDPRASGGFVLELTMRAVFLATHSLAETLTMCTRLASEFGEIAESRLRRFDLAADFAGFRLEPNDIERVQTTRASTTTFRVDSKDVDEASIEHGVPLREQRDAARVVTGLTVAAGNPLMARIYAKDKELNLPGREEKRAIEHTIWHQNGWNGIDPVARVEFQCRGEFLSEIGLRNPEHLEQNVDGVFQLAVRWLRFIEPGTKAKRTRCELDFRWAVVVATVFVHESSPIVRDRSYRGGARPSHVAGAVRSVLAAIGNLPPPEMISSDGEVFASERDFAAGLRPDRAEEWVAQTNENMFRQAAKICSEDLLMRHGPAGSVLTLAARIGASRARFSSADAQRPEDRSAIRSRRPRKP